MGSAPMWLITLIPALLKAMFSAERTKKPGKEKEAQVMEEISPDIVKEAGSVGIYKYFLLVTRLIKAFVRIFNDTFGKNGWGDPPGGK